MININALSFKECLEKVISLDVDPCLYCQYSKQCNRNSINNYGNGPVESYCVSHDHENWVDEEKLRDCVADCLCEDG